MEDGTELELVDSGSGLGLTTRYVAVAVTVDNWRFVTVVAEIAVIVVATSSVIVCAGKVTVAVAVVAAKSPV